MAGINENFCKTSTYILAIGDRVRSPGGVLFFFEQTFKNAHDIIERMI